MTSRAAGDAAARSRDHDDVAAKRRRQMKLIIVGMTLLLILVCVILVAVTLSMSQHIDDMGPYAYILSRRLNIPRQQFPRSMHSRGKKRKEASLHHRHAIPLLIHIISYIIS